MLSRRDGMPADERVRASAAIATRVLDLIGARVAAGAAIAIYAPKGSEVETAALDAQLRDRGFTVAYPRVVDGQRELMFRAVTIDELEPSSYGLREPRLDAGTAIELASIAAFAIPGLAFDRTGGRIGWGRGHYDATLAAAPRALRIGLAFDCQLVDEIEHDPHDARLHLVVTESATHRAD